MSLRRLDNAAWGFQSNCFVCEAGNDRGLAIPFYYDDQAEVVVAEYALDRAFSGTPRYVHGGVTLAVLDEAMAWATIAQVEAFALTRKTSTTFLRPVAIGTTCRVEARVTGRTGERTVEAAAVVRNSDGEPAAESEAVLVLMSPGQAAKAIGELNESDTGYVEG